MFDATAVPVAKDMVLVHSQRSIKSHLLSYKQFQLLFDCNEFSTIRDHAERACQRYNRDKLRNKKGLRGKALRFMLRYFERQNIKLPINNKIFNLVQKQLMEYVYNGLLISDIAIKNELFSIFLSEGAVKENSYPLIKTINIPTCNRPTILRRCLTSYIENNRKFGRNVEYVISDDSKCKKICQQNKDILHSLQREYDLEILYLDRDYREEYIRNLVNNIDLPEEILRFGLLGDVMCRYTVGANRNLLLLHNIGNLHLQVDDDTVCKIVSTVESTSKFTFTSKDANEYRFYLDENSINDELNYCQSDILSIHESLLGKNINSIINENKINNNEIDFEGINSKFLDDVSCKNANICVSFSGVFGDSAMDTDRNVLFRLFLEGDSYKRLIKNTEDYAWKLTTRYILRSPRSATVSNNPSCMTTSIGIDSRDLLPPFSPNYRNEDGVFGALLRTYSSNSFLGYLPFAISHSPLRSRKQIRISDLMLKPRVNDIIQWIIISFNSMPLGATKNKKLKFTGQFLQNIGDLSQKDFYEFIHNELIDVYKTIISDAEHRIETNKFALENWKEDLKDCIEISKKTINEKFFFIPADQKGFSENDRLESFQRYICRYGELIECWPELVKFIKNSSFEPHQKLMWKN
jgi:hypothetical protein